MNEKRRHAKIERCEASIEGNKKERDHFRQWDTNPAKQAVHMFEEYIRLDQEEILRLEKQ
jgi:hypothetical protein